MKYFDLFNKMYYPFNIDGDEKNIVVRDITHNVRFLQEFISSIPEKYTYKLKDGERLDVVSEMFYDNPNYDWVIMIANGIYDIYEDMPLTNVEFEEYIKNKYGERANDTHHFINSNGSTVDGKIVIKVQSETPIKKGSILRRKTSFGTYSAIVDNIIQDNIILKISQGNINNGDLVSFTYYKVVNNQIIESTIQDVLVTDSVNFLEFSPVTNTEYEYIRNENKRDIKIVPVEYIPQIVNELKIKLNG